jgi:hypothetical protein
VIVSLDGLNPRDYPETCTQPETSWYITLKKNGNEIKSKYYSDWTGVATLKFAGSPNTTYEIEIDNWGTIPIDLSLTVYAEKSTVTLL